MTHELIPFAVDADGQTLRGTIRRPSGPGPFPAVALFHGFSGQRMENGRLYVDLAVRLADADFIVLAYDRFGHGESDGAFADITVSRDLDDAVVVLDAFTARDDVDARDLHLVGYSLGAVVAISTAARGHARGNRPVRSVVMWSSASIFADDARSGHLLGVSTEPLATRGYMDMSGQRLGPAFAADAVAFQPYDVAAAFPGPVLLLHGTNDFVPTSCAEQYARVLTDAAVELVEGADHGWSTVPHREHVIARTVEHIVQNRRSEP